MILLLDRTSIFPMNSHWMKVFKTISNVLKMFEVRASTNANLLTSLLTDHICEYGVKGGRR